MDKVSILIPACNEVLLSKTVDDVLRNARGEIEVVVIADGYVPDPPVPNDPRVILIHNIEAIGQRQAVNQAARAATGKYVFKLDAHCMVDEGFDIKLAADCEYDWTLIPRLYQLDAESWTRKLRKKTDFMFIRSPGAETHPFRIDYYDAKCARANPKEYQAFKSAPWRQGIICDTMVSLGAAWFMHRERFWELGGMDENHGHWGQMGVEIACKAWLSGGRHVVNKNTWFAHQWRPKSPWKLTQHQVDRARAYSTDMWINDRWPLQKRPLSWLIDKFAPVPTWNGHFAKKVSDLTLLYYTANRINDHFAEKVMIQLKHACRDAPIISVSQKKMDFGLNICVGDTGRSLQNIYKQVLIGAKQVKTEYVALCEDDTLYIPGHFNYRPPKNKFAYNLNRWNLHIDSEPHVFSYRNRPILSQCIAPTKLLIECLEQRMDMDVPDKYCGEMGFFEKQLGLKEYETETFETEEPNVVVCHNRNTSGRKYQGKDAEPVSSLAPWGDAKTLIDNVYGPTEKGKKGLVSKEGDQMAKFGRGSWKRWQHSYIGSIIFPMEEIMDNLMNFADKRRPGRAEHRMKTLPVFINAIEAEPEKLGDGYLREGDPAKFTNDQLREFGWFDYLCKLYPNWSQARREKRVLEIMRETVTLYHDIKDHGLKAPLDMWRVGKEKLVFHRGWRRLMIMNALHKRGLRDFQRVPVRVFKDIHVFRKYAPSPAWSEGPVDDDSIHGLGMKQFAKLGIYATDKYWVHGYTQQYDRHFAHLRDKKIKLLEIGVFRGASLLLWKEAFPKGTIYGIDKNTAIWKPFLKGQQRIHVLVGRQENQEFLKEKVVPEGLFDVIVDDGGHTPEEQLASFEVMWPMVAPGGIYVIEDLHGNYWKKRAKNGPLFMDEMKKKVDDVVGTNDCLDIHSMACYYNICFLEKNR